VGTAKLGGGRIIAESVGERKKRTGEKIVGGGIATVKEWQRLTGRADRVFPREDRGGRTEKDMPGGRMRTQICLRGRSDGKKT